MRGNVAARAGACIAAALAVAGSASVASATDFTAGVLMDKMDAKERAPYVMGIIEGLAYARYARDNEHLEGDSKTTVGMKCIYGWFYDRPHTLDLIYAAFGKFPTYPPAAIISNLVKQECGA